MKLRCKNSIHWCCMWLCGRLVTSAQQQALRRLFCSRSERESVQCKLRSSFRADDACSSLALTHSPKKEQDMTWRHGPFNLSPLLIVKQRARNVSTNLWEEDDVNIWFRLTLLPVTSTWLALWRHISNGLTRIVSTLRTAHQLRQILGHFRWHQLCFINKLLPLAWRHNGVNGRHDVFVHFIGFAQAHEVGDVLLATKIVNVVNMMKIQLLLKRMEELKLYYRFVNTGSCETNRCVRLPQLRTDVMRQQVLDKQQFVFLERLLSGTADEHRVLALRFERAIFESGLHEFLERDTHSYNCLVVGRTPWSYEALNLHPKYDNVK